MIKEKIKVQNSDGIHARPSALIVNLCKKYNSNIEIYYDNEVANGKDILDVMSLGVVKNSEILVQIDGNDESELFSELKKLIEIDKFFES